MEKAVRENPNTNEIHYERSILGDIYHCSHTCGSPRIFSTMSDTNLTRINLTGSPRMDHRKQSVPPPELHKGEFDTTLIHSNTLESNDSGLPGTPPQLEDSPRSSSILSSPTYLSSGKPSPTKLAPKDKLPSPPAFRTRSNSSSESSHYRFYRENTPGRETDDSEDSDSKGLTYTKVIHSNIDKDTSVVATSLPSSMVTYSKIKRQERKFSTPASVNYNRLSPVVQVSNNAPVPPERRESRFRTTSGSPPCVQQKCTSPSRGFQIPSGSVPPPPQKLLKKSKTEPESSILEMVRDCSEDRDQPVAVYAPEPRGRSGTHFVPRELQSHAYDRRMSHHSEMSIPPRPLKSRGVLKSTSDELEDDRDQSYKLDSLAELRSIKPFFRLDEQEYDETDNEGAMEVMSNLLDYQSRKKRDPYCQPSVIDKVLSKVACDNVRGYAYQITIPAADVIYAVPRREAPIPNTNNINRDAPPKPLRHEGSCFSIGNGHSLDYLPNVTTEA